ncbi:hypothetical protein D3C79_861040 [compost metagenome]
MVTASALRFGIRSVDLGLGLVDHCLLQLLDRIKVDQAGLLRRHGALGFCQGGAVVAYIDAGKYITGLDELVVQHRHLTDIARHFGTDDRDIGAHVSIVGAFDEAAGQPPVAGIANGTHQGECQQPQAQYFLAAHG